MVTKDNSQKRNICHQCGHVWTNRVGVPQKCPRCQSLKWNDPSYRLVCYRCGHTWVSRSNKGSSEIRICPKCKSRKWNEVIGLDVCISCGRRFTRSRNRRFCSKCSGEDNFEASCTFCGVDWISPEEEWSVCPACGALHNKGRLPEDRMIWSCGRTVLRFCPLPDVSVLYLWMDYVPVSCCYMHELVSMIGVPEEKIVSSFNDPSYDTMWSIVASTMYNERDDYRRDIAYYVDTFGLSESDAEILALHSTGMAPEALAIHFGTSQEDIRLSFDRIMKAYKDKGIVVDDTIYTENPKSQYRSWMHPIQGGRCSHGIIVE